jgi:hypothetical protein
MNPIRNNDFQILNSRNSQSDINNNQAENNRYEEEEEKIFDNFSLLNSFNESLNKDLSQSVFDLVKCFICYNQAVDPLSCPKCNNFACSKCLEMYFGNQRAKKCPLCKQIIELKELKKNEVISDVENILNKVESHKNKIEELELLIKEKKNSWENQANNINSILNRIFKYQDMLKAYKKEYQIFLVNCQDVVQNTFEKYLKKTEEITQNLLNYNKLASQSIILYNNMSKRKKDEKNIKDLINEIVNMERKQFNNKNQSHDEIIKFLNAPIKMIPIINQYYVKEITLYEKEIKEYNKITKTGIHYKIGDFQLVYTLNINEGYKVICEFSFKVKNGMNACFLASQTKIEKDLEQTLYPMQLVKHENNEFIYECFFPIDRNELGPHKWIKLKTDVLAFYM